MSGPSPTSHLYRLGIVLVVFFTAAILIGWWAVPSSWNFDLDNWYRKDALIDIASKPLVYGGNESCKDCHQPAMKKLAKFEHAGLSCESCHGPIVDHVRGNKRFAAAKVDKSRWPCENCHLEQINRPEGFPEFSKTGEIGKFVKKHKRLNKKTLCLECHDAHDPTN